MFSVLSLESKMKEEPFFSIVIPVFNKENYVETTVKSLQQQSFTNFEVICIDDASTDKSFEILDNIQGSDKRFKCIKNKNNIGVSSSRNVGIDIARGCYVLFLDADDYFANDTLDCLYFILKTNSDIDVLIFNGNFVNEEGGKLDSFYSDFLLKDIPQAKKFYINEAPFVLHIVNAALLCVRKDFLLKEGVRFQKDMRHEDWEFCWHLFSAKPRMYFVNKKLYNYVRVASGYTMSSNTLHGTMDLFKAYSSGEYYLKKNGLWEVVNQSARIVAIRHFYDFLIIKVMKSNDEVFRQKYVKAFMDFVSGLKKIEYYEIVRSPDLVGSPNVLRLLRYSRSLNLGVPFAEKLLRPDTKVYISNIINLCREFWKPFAYSLRWISMPPKIIIVLVKMVWTLVAK